VSLEFGPASPHPGFQVQTNNVSSVRPSPRQSESRANAACRAWVVSPSVECGQKLKLLLLIPSTQRREAPLASLRASVIRIQQWAWHGMGRAGWLAGLG
jgi:hypothetical protein